VPDAMYVVYDPPTPDFPYLGALFRPGLPPRVFIFETFLQAKEFLTSNAVKEIPPATVARHESRDLR
jgi:hypothetical protein